ncbi:ankyrin repeat domain-containing protein [Collimonas sp. H4R21]|uniref:Ankyrin repeat domain-containing protein n=1 Tax=Collimonas rhizosphaerae TaxID=3126357 RepID=A0ABU9PU35_9BURK
MAKILKAVVSIAACLLIFVAPGISTAATKESVAQSKQDVKAAGKLLDSWHGEGQLLEQAQQKLAEAIKLDPQNYFAFKELARLQVMAGYINGRNVRNGIYLYMVGNYSPGTLDAAEALVRESIRINPGFAEGYVYLGYIQMEQTKLDDAAKSLTQAEALGTDDPWLQLNWASLNNARGEFSTATARWQRVLKSGTSNKKALSSAYGFLIDSYKQTGDTDKVLALYKERIKLRPTNAWLLGDYAEYLGATLGRNDEAIEQANAALKIMDYGVGRRILAYALYRKWADMVAQDAGNDAEKYFQSALAIDPRLEQIMAYGGSEPAGAPLAKALSTRKGVSIDSRGEDGSTALLLATNLNRVKLVQALLDLNANPNVLDRNGWTPLLSAADEGNAEIVSMLLAKGADVRAKKGGWDAAAFAERKGNSELAALLKKRAEDTK